MPYQDCNRPKEREEPVKPHDKWLPVLGLVRSPLGVLLSVVSGSVQVGLVGWPHTGEVGDKTREGIVSEEDGVVDERRKSPDGRELPSVTPDVLYLRRPLTLVDGVGSGHERKFPPFLSQSEEVFDSVLFNPLVGRPSFSTGPNLSRPITVPLRTLFARGCGDRCWTNMCLLTTTLSPSSGGFSQDDVSCENITTIHSNFILIPLSVILFPFERISLDCNQRTVSPESSLQWKSLWWGRVGSITTGERSIGLVT